MANQEHLSGFMEGTMGARTLTPHLVDTRPGANLNSNWGLPEGL
jgi:hypothetical protein